MMKNWHKELAIRGNIHGSQELYLIYEDDEYCHNDKKYICEIFREGDIEEFNSKTIEFTPNMFNVLKEMNDFLNKNPHNKIRSGSEFHNKIRNILSDIRKIKE